MKPVEKSVKEFKKEFKVRRIPDLAKLRLIIKAMSYQLLPYQGNETLLMELYGTTDIKRPAITMSHKRKRYVFYNAEITERDLLFILAHEIGHIYLNHIQRSEGYYDTSEYREEEANEFASMLMHKQRNPYVLHISSAAAVITFICSAQFILPINDIPDTPAMQKYTQQSPTPVSAPNVNDVVITETGDKYHKPDCGHIKDKESLKTVTIDEAIKFGYESCMDCF